MSTKLTKAAGGYTYGDYTIRRETEADQPDWLQSRKPEGWIVEYAGEKISLVYTRSEAVRMADRHDHGFWWTRAEAFAIALDNLADTLSDEEIKAEVVRLVAEHSITSGDFIELDERPGQFHIHGRSYTSTGSTWHRRLRITRNDPNAPLFESMRK